MRMMKYLGRLMKEFCAFALQNKAWWIVPIVVTMLALSALIVSGSISLPFFVYTF